MTEEEWEEVNRIADRRGTSVDALLRKWGVERILSAAECPGEDPDDIGPAGDEG